MMAGTPRAKMVREQGLPHVRKAREVPLPLRTIGHPLLHQGTEGEPLPFVGDSTRSIRPGAGTWGVVPPLTE